jgi:tetratricopeptide (TPR) repeat protein
MTYRVALTILLSTIMVFASTASAKSPYQQTTQTQNDRTQVAEAADSEGKRLHALGTIDALRNALEKFEKALTYWRSLGNRGAEAETLGHIATIHGLLGDREKAIDLFHQQLAIWESIPDRQKEAAESLTNLGIVYTPRRARLLPSGYLRGAQLSARSDGIEQ